MSDPLLMLRSKPMEGPLENWMAEVLELDKEEVATGETTCP